MTRLAPWQRNMIAMAHGFLIKPSTNMKWIANVTAFTTTPQTGTNYSLFPIEADNEHLAAQSAAKAVACLMYQNEAASVGFVNQIEERLFRVTVGMLEHGQRIKGHTLEILIREYEGKQ